MDRRPASIEKCIDPRLTARVDDACESFIESVWKRSNGLALRISPVDAGVVERPGRTRFDLRVSNDPLQIGGPLRCSANSLPILDQSLGLVVLDRTGVMGLAVQDALVTEALRMLADDGHLLVIDYNPLGWLGLKAKRRGLILASTAARIRRVLRASDLEHIETDHRLWWPPLPSSWLNRCSVGLERIGQRLWPALGSIYAVSGRKRGNNVILIPLGQRSLQHNLMTTAGSMRRAN